MSSHPRPVRLRQGGWNFKLLIQPPYELAAFVSRGPCFLLTLLHKQTHTPSRGKEPKPTAISWGQGKHVHSLENVHMVLAGCCSPPPSKTLARMAFLNPYLPGCSHLLPSPCQPLPGSALINRDRDSLQLSGSGGENSF